MTAALIVNAERKLLLVHNTKHDGLRIEPPGGKKEEGEDLIECIKREVREELGIEIEPFELFGVYKTNSPEGEFKVFMYLSKILSGKPKIIEKEKISAYGWYSISDMENFREKGILVPNLVSSLDKLRKCVAN